MLGLCEMTNTTTFGIRIARDKALLISDVAIDMSSGWHKEGFAASSCDDAWSIFQISGQNAEHLLRQGCSSEITYGSPSAAIGFAGQLACLVKNESANLLLYPSPMERYLWSWLEGAE